MKALVSRFNGRGHKDWEVLEHTSENKRAFLWETNDTLDFRVVKKTGEIEFPPSQYTQWYPRVILTEEQWEKFHAPDPWELARSIQSCRDHTILRQIANVLGISKEIPEFPLVEKDLSPPSIT
jgi:hypothetical protein